MKDEIPTFEKYLSNLEGIDNCSNFHGVSKCDFFEEVQNLIRIEDYFSIEISGHYTDFSSRSGELHLVASTSNRAWEFRVGNEPTSRSPARIGVSNNVLFDNVPTDASKIDLDELWFHTRRPFFSEITLVFYEHSEIFGGPFSDFNMDEMRWLNERFLIIVSREQNKPENHIKAIFDTWRKIAIYIEVCFSNEVYFRQFVETALFRRTANSEGETQIYYSQER